MGIEGIHGGTKFTCHKAGNYSINSIMNSLVLDVPTMAIEPQLKGTAQYSH
jgi:hypothetical protein